MKPHEWTDGGDKVLILRRCNHDMSSYGGFVWPSSGPVEFADFNPSATCGGGGHGWPWGMGLGDGADYDIIGDKWLVVAAIPDQVVGELDLGSKCKIRSGEVVYCGSFSAAWAMINSGRHRLIEEMSTDKTESSGNSSKSASSGNCSTSASSGDSSTSASSGDSSTSASSGDSSKSASSGNSSTSASSGNCSTSASSGNSSKSASSGNYSTSASSGNYSTSASSGNSSKSESIGINTAAAVVGHGGRVKVGENGAFAIAFWTDVEGYRFLVGKVGECGIKADTWYEVKSGQLSECL